MNVSLPQMLHTAHCGFEFLHVHKLQFHIRRSPDVRISILCQALFSLEISCEKSEMKYSEWAVLRNRPCKSLCVFVSV